MFLSLEQVPLPSNDGVNFYFARPCKEFCYLYGPRLARNIVDPCLSPFVMFLKLTHSPPAKKTPSSGKGTSSSHFIKRKKSTFKFMGKRKSKITKKQSESNDILIPSLSEGLFAGATTSTQSSDQESREISTEESNDAESSLPSPHKLEKKSGLLLFF